MKTDPKRQQLTEKFENLRLAIRKLCPDAERGRRATQRLNLAEMQVNDAFERKRTDYEGCLRNPLLGPIAD